MGKILILTFSDSEEPIMDKILTAVEGEPTVKHKFPILPFTLCNTEAAHPILPDSWFPIDT